MRQEKMGLEALSASTAALEMFARQCERKGEEARVERERTHGDTPRAHLMGQEDAYKDAAYVARDVARLLRKERKVACPF